MANNKDIFGIGEPVKKESEKATEQSPLPVTIFGDLSPEKKNE